jgi:hypothetical protein
LTGGTFAAVSVGLDRRWPDVPFVSHAIRIHLSRVVSLHLDDILADSFPASDPPSWTLGYVSPALASDEAGAPEADQAVQDELSLAAAPLAEPQLTATFPEEPRWPR